MKVCKVKLNKLKNIKNSKLKFKRIFLIVILGLLVILQIGTVFSFNQQTYAETVPAPVKTGLDLNINYSDLTSDIDSTEIVTVNEKKAEYEKKEAAAIKRTQNINKLVSFLKKYKSPVATQEYAAQIIDLAEANSADYRIIVAIMGVESGFCRVPLKIGGSSSYNCFGYLNGVKYADFKDAFNNLIPKISRQYANRYGWDFESLAKAYGQIGWESTSSDMRGYASSL